MEMMYKLQRTHRCLTDRSISRQYCDAYIMNVFALTGAAMRCDVMNKYHHIGGCRQLQKCCQEIASSRLHPHRKCAPAHSCPSTERVWLHPHSLFTRLDSTRYMHRTDPLGNYDNLDACALVTRPCTSWNCRFTLTNPPVSAFRRSSPINKPILICRKKSPSNGT